jgi:hypothetical protein
MTKGSTLFTLRILVLLSLCAAPALGQEGMQGDCESFKTPLAKEFEIWAAAPTESRTTTEASNAPLVSLGKKTALMLVSQSSVKFVAKPQKEIPISGPKYAGLAKMITTQAGLYRVSLGAKAWVELVDLDKHAPEPTAHFEMQRHCDRIFKVVEFNLKPQHAYLIEISSSAKEKLNLLVTSALP